jgi:hypothetical protein
MRGFESGQWSSARRRWRTNERHGCWLVRVWEREEEREEGADARQIRRRRPPQIRGQNSGGALAKPQTTLLFPPLLLPLPFTYSRTSSSQGRKKSRKRKKKEREREGKRRRQTTKCARTSRPDSRTDRRRRRRSFFPRRRGFFFLFSTSLQEFIRAEGKGAANSSKLMNELPMANGHSLGSQSRESPGFAGHWPRAEDAQPNGHGAAADASGWTSSLRRGMEWKGRHLTILSSPWEHKLAAFGDLDSNCRCRRPVAAKVGGDGWEWRK